DPIRCNVGGVLSAVPDSLAVNGTVKLQSPQEISATPVLVPVSRPPTTVTSICWKRTSCGPLQVLPLGSPTETTSFKWKVRTSVVVKPTTPARPLPPAIATPASTSRTSVNALDCGGAVPPASAGLSAATTSNACRPAPSASPLMIDPSPPSGRAAV